MKTIKKLMVFVSALFLLIGSAKLAGAQALLPEEVAVIQLINQQRADRGIAPLWQNTQLFTSAYNHSEDMATNNYFSHTGSDGSTFLQRDQQAGYTGSPYGECIGWGYPTAQAMVDGWMNSPPHYAIIMSTSADRIGVSHQSDYWTLDVGYGGSVDAAGVIYQLTNNNGAFDVSPQVINDGRVLWQGWDGHDYEIYRQSLGQNPVQVTSNSGPDVMPEMNALGQAVWMNWDGSNWQVWYNLGNGPVQLTKNLTNFSGGLNVHPQITDDGQIYWQGWDGQDYEIYRYNPATQVTSQLTSNTVPDAAPQINASGKLTWMEYNGGNWQVCYNLGSGPVQLTTSGANLSPQISDDGQIFWQGKNGSDYEIYRYNTGSGVTTQLTNNTVDDTSPAVKNGILVWSQWNGSYWQVLSTGLITQITSDSHDNKNPQVNASGQIVWQKWDGSDYEIYVYK